LIIVPRHPERFNSIGDMCLNQGYSVVNRSDNKPVTHEKIWLLDSLGELMAAYALSDIVTMGGSFSHIGGHNPLEPALFKKPIIVGSDMSNFTEVMQQLQQESGLIQLTKPPLENCTENQVDELYQVVITLLENPEKHQKLGLNAHHVVLKNQGASRITLNKVAKLLP
jgi:3-deoxy-D-manno-octulosonic-acid transferase